MTPAEEFTARVRAEALEAWRCLYCHTLKWRGFPCKACGRPVTDEAD